MSKKSLIAIIAVLLIIVGVESYLLIDKNNKEHDMLAEKVIIQTHEELIKAGEIYRDEPVGLILSNMKMVSAAYTGDDKDIEEMLFKVEDYLAYRMYVAGYHPSYDGNIEEKENTFYYGEVKASIDKCISKYALFDKVGLY